MHFGSNRYHENFRKLTKEFTLVIDLGDQGLEFNSGLPLLANRGKQTQQFF